MSRPEPQNLFTFVGMIKKGQKLYSILFMKCPRCHEGELFSDKNPLRVKTMFDMPTHCSHCGQKYQLETSFFYGAMYVNYGITVAISLAVYAAMSLISSDWELHHYIIGIIGALALSVPFTFRLGRSVWINMFVKYEKRP